MAFVPDFGGFRRILARLLGTKEKPLKSEDLSGFLGAARQI